MALCIPQDIEEQCKWALLAVAMLIQGLRERGAEEPGFVERVAKIFEELLTSDPMRERYYLDMRRSVVDSLATKKTT